MPAAVTVRKPSTGPLFRAHLRGDHLKAMAACAKAISDTIVIDVDSESPEHVLRFWADDGDDRPAYALAGQVNNGAFLAVDGDGTQHTVQMPTKHLLEVVNSFDLKRAVDFRLIAQDGRLLMSFQQGKDDTAEPDARTISVQASDTKPTVRATPKAAYAAVNLKTINKVLTSLKGNTDVVTVAITPPGIEIAASTKRLQDSWKHATTSRGEAKDLFRAAFLKKVVAGALALDEAGEFHLVSGHLLKVSSANEDMEVSICLASRDVMK